MGHFSVQPGRGIVCGFNALCSCVQSPHAMNDRRRGGCAWLLLRPGRLRDARAGQAGMAGLALQVLVWV